MPQSCATPCSQSESIHLLHLQHKFKHAMQLVAESGMDLEKALAEFKEAKADGEIPPEAFGEA